MRIRPALLGVLAAAVGAAAVPAGRVWYASRFVRLGPLEASPAPSRLSLRIGARAEFSARAEHATSFTWRLSGRRVSSEPSWSYVPGPEGAGRRQVTVEVLGRNGEQVGRSWDVGVVVAVLPEIEDVTPAPGPIAVAPGEKVRFHCRAHLPGGLPADRLAFEWIMDDRPVLSEQRAAEDAFSEFVLPSGSEPGPHRLRLEVSEDGRSAAIVDWAVDVGEAPPEAMPVQAEATPAPPVQPASTEEPVLAAIAPPFARTGPSALFTEPGPPRAVPLRQPASRPLRPRLIRAPGSRHLRGRLGERVVLEARVEPEGASVSYRWTVDGRPMRRHARRLEYEPANPGPHRVELTVEAGRHAIGRDAWVVSVPAAARPPSLRAANSQPVRRLDPRPKLMPVAAPPVSATPASLAEADVRRWLDEYARAWSRKDIAALQRMGQFRSAADAAQIERYFQSIGVLQVKVRVLELTVDGRRALVEFERIDTMTDPSGRHQELRLPPIHKEIEQTPEGLRFTGRAGHG